MTKTPARFLVLVAVAVVLIAALVMRSGLVPPPPPSLKIEGSIWSSGMTSYVSVASCSPACIDPQISVAWGDGKTTALSGNTLGGPASHTFSLAGTYTIVVTVTSLDSRFGTFSQTVTVPVVS